MAASVLTGDHRRIKTALFLLACVCAGFAPHWLDPHLSLIPAFFLAFLLGGYGWLIIYFKVFESEIPQILVFIRLI